MPRPSPHPGTSWAQEDRDAAEECRDASHGYRAADTLHQGSTTVSTWTLEPDLLRGMDPRHRERVMALGTGRKLTEDEVVFRLGEEAKGVFLVLGGRVNLTLPISLDGRQEDILVEERVEGQLLGWSGLVPPHRFTLQAKAPVATELLFIPREELEALFVQVPEVAAGIYGNLARIIGQRLQVFQAMWVRSVQRGMAHGRG